MPYTNPNKLKTMTERLNRLPQLYQALLSEVCTQVLAVLTTETPGSSLRLEWIADQRVTGDGRAIGRISNTRVDDSPEQWGKILLWLDLGTFAHEVKPVIALALHWIDPETGGDRFSRGHVVSGIKASHFMSHADRTIQRYMKTVPAKVRRYMKTGQMPG